MWARLKQRFRREATWESHLCVALGLVPILWWATETAIDPDDKAEFVIVGIMTIVQFTIGAGAKFFRQD